MNIITANPDEWRTPGRRVARYAGPDWLAGISEACVSASKVPKRYYTIDLSNLDFVTLSAWVGMVAFLERLAANPLTTSVGIDLKGHSELRLLSPSEFIDAEAHAGEGEDRPSRGPEFLQARRMYQISGFIESLGTRTVLNIPGRGDRISYIWLGEKGARLKAFATRPGGKHTVVMPLMRIETKAHCKQFLEPEKILNWREAMGDKFRTSPLFESEEVWRIFCHELSVNIFEHAGSAGFLAARVVDREGLTQSWCEMSYSSQIRELFPLMSSGFLELCISDGGQGFAATLERAYRKQVGLKTNDPARPQDILQFAFDEVGTCKKENECWATERHALGRILQIVAKYGGALALRSSGAEVVYVSHGGPFERRPNHLGYRAQTDRLCSKLQGSDLQVILPLVPFVREAKEDWRRSILISSLPTGFHADPTHVRGHLVPLLEVLDSQDACVGPEELRAFRKRCEALATRVIEERPPLEPIILDFSSLNWTPAQFETLLHLLQNVLQNRPVLLVEIEHNLVREVVEMEKSAPTQLAPEVADRTPSVTGRAFAELSETSFLETYHRVHATVLGLDIHGKPHVLGLKHRWCEPLLLSLIEKPQTLESLCTGQPPDNERALRAIFNNMNPLFCVEEDGRWRTVWDKHAIDIEARRVMTRHFDVIADHCQAWRGRVNHYAKAASEITGEPEILRDKYQMTFNLPWQKEWVCEFFESSRILSRQRYADEAAQRLIFRLERGLRLDGKTLEDVHVLACVTAPAILLATALHRWWPNEKRPAIADLGHYLMLNPDGPLPAIASFSGIVVVQDVLDRRNISNRLVGKLREQKKEVLCVLSLARLVDAQEPVGVTPIDEGWQQTIHDPPGLKSHALVNLLRPQRCPPSDHNDPRAHWVEPRTLRPFRYSTLRREVQAKGTPRERLRPFFTPKQRGIICAGHYVYGERHFRVALDIKAALDGEIGGELAAWLADVCQGVSPRSAEWESHRGKSLPGDVTAVLMPLHSQIHYLWPRVERLLAQRGRRQMMWVLDATLFLGHGPAYRLPLQFLEQIRLVMRSLIEAKRFRKPAGGSAIRILILDDSIFSARTTETILAEIDRAVSKACEAAGAAGEGISPIQWIRYVAVFNQMSHAKYLHWKNLNYVGSIRTVPFVFDAYRSILGGPTFEEENCPCCADARRLERLVAAAKRHSTDLAGAWAEQQGESLQPIAIDSPGFQKNPPVDLPRPIDLLGRKHAPVMPDQYQLWNADEAILRFYELMYMSYPPSDVLRSLSAPNAWAASGDGPQVAAEYARFRWGVLEWCLRNWPRLVADSARDLFFECVRAEVGAESTIAEALFEGMSRQRNDEEVKAFIVEALQTLARLETQKPRHGSDSSRNAGPSLLLLEKALTIVLLSIPHEELVNFTLTVNGNALKIVDFLSRLASSRKERGLSVIGNLHLCFSRPRRADPAWALQVLAENLFRGRDPDNAVMSSHRLLPKLLSDLDLGTATSGDRRLLLSSLNLFLAALADLARFAAGRLLPFREIAALGGSVLDWLKTHPEDGAPPRSVTELLDALSPDQAPNPGVNFYGPFSKVFHVAVGDLESLLAPAVNKAKEINPDFTFKFQPNDVQRFYVLTVIDRLCGFLTNWAIDPAQKPSQRRSGLKSRIEVHRQPMPLGTDNLRFRILTNFEDLQTTQDRTIHGPNHDREVRTMVMFGAMLPDQWETPSEPEQAERFTACYEFQLPTGFTPKQKNHEL